MSQLRVLVVDDLDANRRLLGAFLESLGCVVTTAENGAEAVGTPGAFDAIFLDRQMPVMGGDEAARRLKGRALLIACSADGDVVPACYDAWLEKPLSLLAVARMVEALRRGRESARHRDRRASA